MKRLIKGTLQQATATVGPHRWRGGGQLVILMYHRILPPDDVRYQDEQPGMIVHPDTFDQHLSLAKRHFDLVDLATWLTDAAEGKPLPKRALAITFDDGWRDNLEFALPVLEQHRAPATIFLVSDMVGVAGNYWPEQLAASIRIAQSREDSIWEQAAFSWLAEIEPSVRMARDAESIDTAIVAAKTRFNDAELRQRSSEMLEALGDPLRDQPRALLDWDEIRRMQDGGLVRFGSHTIDHTRLTDALAPDDIARQLGESKQALERGLGTAVPLFCYPNGDHCPEAVKVAAQHYEAAVTTHSGWNDTSSHRHLLNRIGVHQGNSATPAAFLSRLSGWL